MRVQAADCQAYPREWAEQGFYKLCKHARAVPGQVEVSCGLLLRRLAPLAAALGVKLNHCFDTAVLKFQKELVRKCLVSRFLRCRRSFLLSDCLI